MTKILSWLERELRNEILQLIVESIHGFLRNPESEFLTRFFCVSIKSHILQVTYLSLPSRFELQSPPEVLLS
jgi:hypothetical protein